MSFLGNTAVNRANIHSSVQILAMGIGGVFYFVFLLRAGVPLPMVMVAFAAISVVRFVLRPLVIPLAKRIGVHGVLIAGTVLESAAFLVLPFVTGANATLILLILVTAPGSVLYWTSYHAYFATIGDAQHRGGQIGVREALTAAINIIAPLVGGWMLVTFGAIPAFFAAAAIQVCAVLPLLGGPKVWVAPEAPGATRAARHAAAMTAADGWFGAGYYYIWQLALFVSLGENFQLYGGAMALAGVAGAAAGLLTGRLIDLGHGRRSTLVVYGIGAALIVLRAASLDTPWLAVLANAAGALFAALVATVMMTPIYNMSQRSPCPLRFSVATEGGWDLGAAGAGLLAAALTAAGLPLSASILLALLGGAAAAALLWRAYAPVGSPSG